MVTIYPAGAAFAALKAGGSVVSWGDSDLGGDSSAVASNLSSDVVSLSEPAETFIAASSAVIGEGNSGSTAYTFTVTRTGYLDQASATSWAVTGRGANPASATDFEGGIFPSGTVNFAAGQATSQTITVNVTGDRTVEPDEGFNVTLSAPSSSLRLGTAMALGIILNDDTSLLIAADAASQTEGNSGTTPFTFTVTRGGDATGRASADWSVTGGGVSSTAAANGAGFAGGQLPSGRVNFAAGQTSQTVTVNVAGDAAIELNDSFTVTLAGLQAGVTLGIASATGVILNDDFPPTGELSIARLNASRSEGQSGTTAFTFVVTRSGDKSGPASATWAVTGGTSSGTVAANAADFTGGVLPSGRVSFAVNETSKIVTVSVAGDRAEELNESFTVTLANPLTGVTIGTTAATGIICDDDTPGTGALSIARASAQKAEGHSGSNAFTFTVTRGGDATGTASTDWAVTGGGVSSTTAANGADFAGGQLPSGRVHFATGQTSQTVTVNVAGDAVIEMNDSFTVTLAGLQAGVALGAASATGVILNDDFPPTGELSIARLNASRSEGQSGTTDFTFVVTRSGGTTGPASANWTVTPGNIGSTGAVNGTDFVGGALPSGTVSLAPGETSKVVTVAVAGDGVVEPIESFTVTLSGPPAGVTIGTVRATALIWNDDTLGTGALAIAPVSAEKAEGNSGSTAFTFTVTRTGDTAGTAGADWAVTGGGVASITAASGADFIGGQLPAGHVVFSAAQAAQTPPCQ